MVPVDKLSPSLNSVVDAFSHVSPLHHVAGSNNFAKPADCAVPNTPEADVCA